MHMFLYAQPMENTLIDRRRMGKGCRQKRYPEGVKGDLSSHNQRVLNLAQRFEIHTPEDLQLSKHVNTSHHR